jgi:hypothetical protein
MPYTSTENTTARIPKMPDPAVEAEWNWPRPAVSQVECIAHEFRREPDAGRSGFFLGVGSVLDLLGSLPFVFFRRAPYTDDAEALTDDWAILRGDFLIAHERVHNELTRRWPEQDWPARQGTLFDAEAPEPDRR